MVEKIGNLVVVWFWDQVAETITLWERSPRISPHFQRNFVLINGQNCLTNQAKWSNLTIEKFDQVNVAILQS
jgi:hypothetical protein